MISHRYKFIFIHIPRTGGTSVESLLRDESCELLSNQWHPTVRHAPLNHLTLQEMIDHGFVSVETLRSYFKFCFVRNPWDRAVSEAAYLGGILGGDDLTAKLSRMLERDTYGNHIRPQVEFIDTSHGVGVDFIGRFETLQRDVDKVCAVLGLPRRRLSLRNGTAHRPYWTCYDDVLRRKVEMKYACDIERFAYRFLPR